MTTVTKVCPNCAAFSAEHNPNYPVSPGYVGRCRYNPPTVLMTPPVAAETHGNPEPFFPEVKADWWCLQFKVAKK